MRGPAVVLALFTLAQVIAAVTMLALGRVLQAVNPDAGWVAWLVVGVAGILAAVAFLSLTFDWKRWSQWPRPQ